MSSRAVDVPLCHGEGEVAAAVVLATEPGASLPYVEERLLARFVEHVDRKVHQLATADDWREVMRRMFRMAAVAGRVPVANGIALVATPDDARLLHLRAPVRDRVHVGPVPTLADLDLLPWPEGSLAIAVVTETLARAVVLGDGLLVELAGAGLPQRRDPGRFVDEHLSTFEQRLLAELDGDVPIVLGGDERVAEELRTSSAIRDRVAGVLPGDVTRATPGQLLSEGLRRAERVGQLV